MKTKLKLLPKKIALRLLIDNLTDNNDYILLLSRWNSNERDKRAGVISEENYKMYKARIEHALNEYIAELSEADITKVWTAANMDSAQPQEPIKSNSTTVSGDNNIVIQGSSGSDITIIRDSKNVITGSTINAGGDVRVGDGSPSKPREDSTTNKKVVLFVAANPSKEARLKLRIEHSTIAEELEGKIDFDFRTKMAVSRKELNMEVAEKEPNILHFSGHGIPLDSAKAELIKLGFSITDDTGLAFHNKEKNGIDTLSASKSEQIFRGLKAIVPNLNIVILNACYSEAQAIAISKNNIYTIGTSNRILDEAAIAFAQGFYWEYAKSNNVKAAVRFGILQANTELKDESDANDLIHLFHNGQKIEI